MLYLNFLFVKACLRQGKRTEHLNYFYVATALNFNSRQLLHFVFNFSGSLYQHAHRLPAVIVLIKRCGAKQFPRPWGEGKRRGAMHVFYCVCGYNI